MTRNVHFHPNLIDSPGTQVVALRDVADQGHVSHSQGAVGIGRVLMEKEPRTDESKTAATGVAERFGYSVEFRVVGPKHVELESTMQVSIFTLR